MDSNLNLSAEQLSQRQKEKLPVGIIIILLLTAFQLLTTLLSLKKPIFVISSFVMSGAPAILCILFIAAISGLILYGILKQKTWARKLILVWYPIKMAGGSINFISFLSDKQKIIKIFQSYSSPGVNFITERIVMLIFLMTLFISWVSGMVIIVYIYRKKDFFKN